MTATGSRKIEDAKAAKLVEVILDGISKLADSTADSSFQMAEKILMRVAYLDCFAGISGDMLLGALIDAGVPLAVLQEATTALKLGASLKVETVDRSGIACAKVHVLEGEHLAEDARRFEHQRSASEATHSHQPKTQHLHKTGHAHEHDPSLDEKHAHEHTHGRSLTVIRRLIEYAVLDQAVKSTALRAFQLLGESEAKIHNVPVDKIHFHEVGAVDAIVDIVAASAGIHYLQIDEWHSSPVNVGGGMVQCAHGLFPIPAPATADLLRGFPTYSAHVEQELVTPTGAALLRALDPIFGAQPAMQVDRIGYGAGTRNPKDFPNVLRLSVGETVEQGKGDQESETVTVLETALDDLSPQVVAHVAESLLAAGALDVMLIPVTMKKGRPGTLLTVLCEPPETERLTRLILRETSTLGVRMRQDRRLRLERSYVPIETEFGNIRMKIGSLGSEEMNAAPEFEDCKAAALKHGVALKQVQQAVIAAYRNGRV